MKSWLQDNPEVAFEKVELLEKQVEDKEVSLDSANSPSAQANKKELKLKPFNPNTVSEEDLLSFGLRDKLCATWANYLAKGGSFTSSSDLEKLYGIRSEEVELISPYLLFEKADTPVLEVRKPILVELNSADTTELKRVPGIGSYYANAIVRLRDLYGGILSLEQLKQLYKVDEERIGEWSEYLFIDLTKVQGLRINKASKEELAKHPYISYNLANSIVKYRDKHGSFQRPEELQKLVLMHDSIFVKLAPYLKIND